MLIHEFVINQKVGRKSNTMKNKNARKSNKNVKATKGQPGAPKKAVKYPRGNFTVASAIKFNAKTACGLTVRNRITEDVENGLLVENGKRPQAGGAVGRPSTLYILATLAKTVKAKTKAPKAPTAIKAPRKTKAASVTLAPVLVVEPAQAPVTNVVVTKVADVDLGNGQVAEVSDVAIVPAGEKAIPAVVPAPLP